MRAQEFITEEAKAAKYNGLLMKYAFNNSALVLKAFDPTKTPIAYVKFVKEDKELYPQDLWVHDDFRNRGIAKSMYDFLKNEGYIINRSHDQTKAGAGFWDKHRGEDEYVWEDEKLDELFQPGKNWTWAFRGSEEAFAEFTVGDVEYLWYARTGNEPTTWTITFKRKGQDTPEKAFGLSGTGNSAEVMSTVIDITRAFLEHYADRVLELRFSSAGDSRTSLYAKMVKRLIPNWDLHTKKVGSETDFYLTNPKAYELNSTPNQVDEEVLDEMPLPADWDPQQMRQGATTFKSRLAYALERAKKLGTGSSRVATTIEYQGRPTVLKIAKNAKGLAQNSVEADILSDGYASQLGILIPLIDYDEQNREPSWIHTEMATKASEKQLCQIMGCDNLSQLVNMAWAITGKKKYVGNYESYATHLRQRGVSEEQIDRMTDYANTLADLNSNFDVELGDFARAANWGMYKGKPVIVDVGFNSNVLNQYYKR